MGKKSKKTGIRVELSNAEGVSFRAWIEALLLLLAVIAIYVPVWQARFIWDDNLVVVTNPVIVGPLGLKEIWTTSAADVCPLTLSTFWLEHALWGLSPLPYHLVNVLLHAACAILLWRVLLALRIPGAWLGATLWALHPVMVESVAWIIEMKNTESGLFFLLAILFFVKDTKGAQTGWSTNYTLTLLFSALAMAAKSSTVILPLVLCLAAWWSGGRWPWRHAIKVAPILLMSVIAGLVTMWTQRLGGGDDPQWAQPWPERFIIAGHAVWFYLGKLIWPDPLIFVYPRWEVDACNALSWLPLATVIVALLLLGLNRAKWSRACFFAFVYFLVALLPVLDFAQLFFSRYSFVADHFQYLASMGPIALAATGITLLAQAILPAKAELRVAPGILVASMLGIISWQRATAYESEEALWTDTLAKNPECWVGQNNLGYSLLNQGHLDEAIAHNQEAARLNPAYADPHNNLGIALYQKGQLDEAKAQWEKALELRPKYAEAHNSLANYFLKAGQLPDAIDHYRKALEIKPRYPEAHHNLGMALLQSGQLDDAILQFQKYAEINPDSVEAHNTLGIALYQKHQVSEAIAEFQQALRLKPGDSTIQDNLAKAQAAESSK